MADAGVLTCLRASFFFGASADMLQVINRIPAEAQFGCTWRGKVSSTKRVLRYQNSLSGLRSLKPEFPPD